MKTKLNINIARTQIAIAERSLTLFSDGYRYTTIREDGLCLYGIYKPANQTDRPDYCVFLYPTRRCSCPAFDKYDTCKHILAVEKVEAEEEMKAIAERNGIDWE